MGGYVDVRGQCPACGAESLHIAIGAGMVHCLAPGCPDSGAAGRLLSVGRRDGAAAARARAALEGITPWPWVFSAERDDHLVSEVTGGLVESCDRNTAFIAGAPALVSDLLFELSTARSFRSLPMDMVWQDYCSPDEVLRIRRPLDDEIERLQAEVEQLRALAALHRVTLDREYSDEELRNSPYADAFEDAVAAGPDEYRAGPSDSRVKPEPPQVVVLPDPGPTVVYLHDTQERVTLLASSPGHTTEARHWVERQAFDWLASHEPDSESVVVTAQVVERIEVGDFVMRGPTP